MRGIRRTDTTALEVELEARSKRSDREYGGEKISGKRASVRRVQRERFETSHTTSHI